MWSSVFFKQNRDLSENTTLRHSWIQFRRWAHHSRRFFLWYCINVIEAMVAELFIHAVANVVELSLKTFVLQMTPFLDSIVVAWLYDRRVLALSFRLLFVGGCWDAARSFIWTPCSDDSVFCRPLWDLYQFEQQYHDMWNHNSCWLQSHLYHS